MTVAATDLALLYLAKNAITADATAYQRAHVVVLRRGIHVVELENGDVALAAVDARMLLQIREHERQLRCVLLRTPPRGFAQVVIAVPRVVRLAIGAHTFEARRSAARGTIATTREGL